MKKYLLPLLAALSVTPAASAQWADTLQSIAIAPSNDHVYYWYSHDGGRVASGLTNDPFRYRGPQAFQHLPDWGLMATGINSQDRVYYWWLSNATGQMMVTVGTSQNPIAHQTTIGVPIPPGYILQDVGIASDDRVYYYWRNRQSHRIMNSIGTSTNPVAHHNLRPVEGAIFMQTYDLRHVDIASDDHVYYWWENMNDNRLYVTAGTSTNPFAYRDVYPANQPN